MKKIFFDLETTGTDVRKHSIHQIAGLIEIDGEVVESFDIRTQPHPKAKIEPEALKVGNVTEEQIRAYPPMGEAHKEFKTLIGKYVDPYNKTDKAFSVGYNNRAFDDIFLRAWFEQNGDTFIGSLLWNNTLDTLVLASQYLLERRAAMPSFKLKRVAMELGIEVDADRLHDAAYDVELTRQVYRIVTGLDFEL